MDLFEEGYRFFEASLSPNIASTMSNQYVESIDEEINKLVNNLNSMNGYKSNTDTLKGDVAEFWHAGTYNIKSALNASDNRAYADRSNEFASADITTNFGEDYSLKYYKDGTESARQQAKSVFEKYKEYQSKGGKDKLEDYLGKRGYSNDENLNDPIYSGQTRIIPSDQMQEAISYLELKITKESITRPEQVKRYEETLKLLKDCVEDSKGNKSIELSSNKAKQLATLAKEGNITAEELGLTINELINYEYIIKESFKAGLSSAVISMALKIAPEIIDSLKYLIENGEVDKGQFKELGFAALSGAGEGFVKGTISAALTICCKSGIFGETLKTLNPTIIGTVTVLAYDTMRNACDMVNGKITKQELANELIKETYVSVFSAGFGYLGQISIEIPVLGLMLGSFVGSLIGSFTYDAAYNPVMSFCVSTGFTMFGLVEQNYELPKDVMEEIGIEVFDYEKFDYDHFEYDKFEYQKFEPTRFDYDKIDIIFLRRGVIGVSKIGYLI